MITIKNRWNGKVILQIDAEDLSYANLRGSDLSYSDLSGANLSYSDLRGSDLSYSDLSGANLRGSDLSYSDLSGADLRGAVNPPFIVFGLRWDVYISGTGWMQIGCQKHSVDEWFSFDDETISDMDSNALTFWNAHKELLRGICENYKHPENDNA